MSLEVPGAVAVAYCSAGQVEHEFADALTATLVADGHQRRLIDRAPLSVISGPYLDRARCALVAAFLEATTADWLWMLDADMVWLPEDFYRLVDLADPVERPIVGGLYHSGARAGGPIFPLIGIEGPDGIRWAKEYPIGPVECDATGAGFLLMHRSVLEALQLEYGVLPDGSANPLPWFADEIVAGEQRGEDVVFCLRARALGYRVVVDTRIDVGHKKPMYLNRAVYGQVLGASAGAALEEVPS